MAAILDFHHQDDFRFEKSYLIWNHHTRKHLCKLKKNDFMYKIAEFNAKTKYQDILSEIYIAVF